MNETQIRAQLVTYAQRAYFRGLVHGTGGNFSARLDDERMVVTASGLSLGDTALYNLITVNVNTYQYEPAGDLIPSKEYRFHADILRLRSAVGAVLHAHPVQATAYAVKG
ncbi:MAG: class II aldolase/adducin family protein, partial [Desulfobacterales bacterium]|nr:class II aldolase/adducin family protein [Desulfobacterales bacterium]